MANRYMERGPVRESPRGRPGCCNGRRRARAHAVAPARPSSCEGSHHRCEARDRGAPGNIARIDVGREAADLAFGPVTAAGEYYVYYLPR